MIGILAKEFVKALVIACAPVAVQAIGNIAQDYFRDKRKEEKKEKEEK